MPGESGILIAVEGIDGAGKTTQVQLLKEALQRAGETAVTSKEPTSGPWGRKIKASARNGRLSLEQELDAFIHDREEHVRDLIGPALREGKIIILDRYFYSTIAYQGSRGADVAAIKRQMEELFPTPDMVVLLDLDPLIALRRISELRSESPNEFERVDGLNVARSIFNSLEDPRIRRIDGTQPVEVVHGLVLAALISGPLEQKRPELITRLRRTGTVALPC